MYVGHVLGVLCETLNQTKCRFIEGIFLMGVFAGAPSPPNALLSAEYPLLFSFHWIFVETLALKRNNIDHTIWEQIKIHWNSLWSDFQLLYFSFAVRLDCFSILCPNQIRRFLLSLFLARFFLTLFRSRPSLLVVLLPSNVPIIKHTCTLYTHTHVSYGIMW